MKRAFALLLLTTTLGAGSAVLASGPGHATPHANLSPRTAPGAALTPVDDDGEVADGGWLWSLMGEDADDDCHDDEGGDRCATGAAGNAARAGTVAPPQNGLFTNGTAPVVTSN